MLPREFQIVYTHICSQRGETQVPFFKCGLCIATSLQRVVRMERG